jgi:serine/threonine protein kinase
MNELELFAATIALADPAERAALLDRECADKPDLRVRLLQQIGEGGMGTVWMADQSEPVKRRVALKLMRVDRAQSKTILSRFEAERQASRRALRPGCSTA